MNISEERNKKLAYIVSIISGLAAIIIALITLLQYCSMKDTLELQREMFYHDRKPDILASTIIDTVRNKVFIEIENFSDYRAKDVQIELSFADKGANSNNSVKSKKFNLRKNQIKYWDITTYEPKMVFSKNNFVSNNAIKIRVFYKKAGDDKKLYVKDWFTILKPNFCNNALSKELDLLN